MMPRDLYVGLWMEELRRPPWELGFGKPNDHALMERARHAVFVCRTAILCKDPAMLTRLSEAQFELMLRMNELIEKENKRQGKRKSRRAMVVRRRRALPNIVRQFIDAAPATFAEVVDVTPKSSEIVKK